MEAIQNESATLDSDYRKHGIQVEHLYQDFLEASELGDAESLRNRLAGLSAEDARQVAKRVDQQGNTGLLLAARAGNLELMRVLLDAGANPNDADGHGIRPLHYAASRISPELTRLLLHACADTDARDDMGETPLMYAAGLRTVNLLLASRADTGAKNKRGETVLMHACRRGNIETIGGLLKTPGALDMEYKNSSGQTAYHIAVQSGNHDAAAMLTRAGATEASDETSQRVLTDVEALHQAAQAGDAELISKVLESGTTEVDTMLTGETPLRRSAMAGQTLAVEALLNARADPNKADAFNQESPLYCATQHNRVEVIWLLLEARADLSQRNGLQERTAFELADCWGFHDCADLLHAAAGEELSSDAPEVSLHWGGPVINIGKVSLEDVCPGGFTSMD